MAQATIPGCDAVGVTFVRAGRPLPVTSVNEAARELDALQCRGEGPSRDAIRQLQVFNVAIPDEASSWPGFRDAAVALGVRSSLSVPITAGGYALGALTLYSHGEGGFVGWEQAALRLAAEMAGVMSGALVPVDDGVPAVRPRRKQAVEPRPSSADVLVARSRGGAEVR